MIGRKGVTRQLLEGEFTGAGAQHATSFLATGNVVFESSPHAVASIVARVSRRLAARIDLQQPMFIRTFRSLRALQETDPFSEYRTVDAFEFCVSFLAQRPRLSVELPHRSSRNDFAIVGVCGNHVFSYTRLVNERPGNPTLWLERQLQCRVTTRNWRTVERMLARF